LCRFNCIFYLVFVVCDLTLDNYFSNYLFPNMPKNSAPTVALRVGGLLPRKATACR